MKRFNAVFAVVVVGSVLSLLFLLPSTRVKNTEAVLGAMLTPSPTPSIFPPKIPPVSCDTLTVPAGTKKILISPSTDPYTDRAPDIQALLTGSQGANTFCFKGGVYALGTGLKPHSDQVLIGEVDGTGKRLATLTGAKKVLTTDITKDGASSRWIITNQVSLGAKAQGGGKTLTDSCSNSEIGGTYTRCVYADQLFLINGTTTKRLQHAETLASLTPGFFFWDYGTNQIYLADDPTGKVVEISRKNTVTTGGIDAIGGFAWRVKVKNLIIEKFGTPTDNAAVIVNAGGLVENNLIQYNHAVGLRFNSDNNIIRNNVVINNGEYGIVGAGTGNGVKYTGNLIENNEIAYNNIAWFGWYHSAGGTKFNYTDGLIMRNNYVHHNIGFGLWLDAPNINALYEANRVEYNRGGGIEHEISGNAIVRNNTALKNGYKKDGTCDLGGWFGGIRAATSNDIEIYNNIVSDNCFGIVGVKSERGAQNDLTNLYVHDNTISQSNPNAKYLSGIRVYECPTCVAADYYTVGKKNNRFQSNNYSMPSLTGPYFYWDLGARTKDYWTQHGNDTTGTFQTPSTATSTPSPTTGDVNTDGKVDLLDFNIWRNEFLSIVTTQQSDLNSDGKIDLIDFNLWLIPYSNQN